MAVNIKDLDRHYAYNKNDLILKEIDKDIPLFFSLLIYVFLFFIAVFYILDPNLLSITNNDLEYIFDISVYFFAAQATIIGLIFPIVIAYIGLANGGKPSSNEVFNIYKSSSGLNILGASSFSLLILYVLVFTIDFFTETKLIWTLQFELILWFLFNIYLSYIFLIKTLNFIDGQKRIYEITKYAYNNNHAINNCLQLFFDDIRYTINDNIRSIQHIHELSNFIAIIIVKYDLQEDNLTDILFKIRKFTNECFDYNNANSLKSIFYIYYYIAQYLDAESPRILRLLINFSQYIAYDILKRSDLPDHYKTEILDASLVLWSSWGQYLSYSKCDNLSKINYLQGCIENIGLFIKYNLDIDVILDEFITSYSSNKAKYILNHYETIFMPDQSDDQILSNIEIDYKIVLIKVINQSDWKPKNKDHYIKLILNSTTPLNGVVHNNHAEIIDNADVLFSSLLRGLNSQTGVMLSEIYKNSLPSNFRVNKMYMGSTLRFSSLFLPEYTKIFTSYLPNKTPAFYKFENHLESIRIQDQIKMHQTLHDYLNTIKTSGHAVDQDYIQIIEKFIEIIELSIRKYYLNTHFTNEEKNNLVLKQIKDISEKTDFGFYSEKLSQNKFIKLDLPNNNFIDLKTFKWPIFLTELYSKNFSIIKNSLNIQDYLSYKVTERILLSGNQQNTSSTHPINDILNALKKLSKKDHIVIVKSFEFLGPKSNIKYESIGYGHIKVHGFDFYALDNFDHIHNGLYGLIININIIDSIEYLPLDLIASRAKIKYCYKKFEESLKFKTEFTFCFTLKLNTSHPVLTFTKK